MHYTYLLVLLVAGLIGYPIVVYFARKDLNRRVKEAEKPRAKFYSF